MASTVSAIAGRTKHRGLNSIILAIPSLGLRPLRQDDERDSRGSTGPMTNLQDHRAPAIKALCLLLFLLHKLAVAIAGAEIDIDAFDPLALKYEEFGVAERLTFGRRDPISDERLITLLKDAFDLIGHLAGRAHRPAAHEIFGLADVIVIGAGEGEIFREGILQRLTVARLVGGEAFADQIGFRGHGGCASDALRRMG